MVKQIGAGMYPPIFVDVTYQMENKPLTLLASRKLKEVTDAGIVVENLKAGAERRYAKAVTNQSLFITEAIISCASPVKQMACSFISSGQTTSS